MPPEEEMEESKLNGAIQEVEDRLQKLLEIQEALRQSEARFRDLIELSVDWYWEQDEVFRYTMMAGGILKKIGFKQNEFIGKKRWEQPGIVVAEGHWETHKAVLAAHEPFYNFAYQWVDESGKLVHVISSGLPIFDNQGNFKGYRGIGRDVTEQFLSEERIRYLAYHDGLTGLPNRVRFSEILNHSLHLASRHNKKLAVLFIDLDRFKNINDTLGHEAGDILLQEAGKKLKDCLRKNDTVARLGGDEFVVLIEEVVDTNHVITVAQKVLAAMIKPFKLVGQELRVTASVGVSMFPEDGVDEQTLMKNADIALYRAKEEGKNNYQLYSEKMNAFSFQRLALETSLRRALERDEFLLHYQAKLDLRTGKVTGMEALLRWQHPDLGMISPAQFIPIAEETGLIVPIGKWVLATACLQNKAWQDEGLPALRVAVNLSARQFFDDSLVQDISQILTETRMSAGCLELEITESMVMRDPERAVRLLCELKAMGIRLAIDDFGVGYSSLATLKRFPIDTIKVDRSFIRDIPGDAEDKALTEAIIAMGKTLSLTVIAEGVETQQQYDFLREKSCDEFQGYYFSKPIDKDKFAELFREHTKESKS
ncbi:MAG: EAL domain-containing protein [Pseudomonadota bacterium]